MARISFNHPYVNLALGSVDKGSGSATSQPEYKPGMEIKCDSGVYRYLQAASTVAEGYLCKFHRSGDVTSNFGATPMDTTLSGAGPTDAAVAVTSGGLAVRQWGWFWLGEGQDYVHLASTATSYAGNLTTWTTAGQVAATGSGDNVADLVAIDSNTSSGLRLCRSTRLLATNFAVSTA